METTPGADGVISSLRIQTCGNLCLLCVISGLLAGGSPGFRTVLCSFFSHLLYGDFVIGVSLLFVICFLAIPIHLIMQKAIIFSNRAVWRFGCGFVCFVFCFVCFFGFLLGSFLFFWHRDGLLDCVLVLFQHCFCGPSTQQDG